MSPERRLVGPRPVRIVLTMAIAGSVCACGTPDAPPPAAESAREAAAPRLEPGREADALSPADHRALAERFRRAVERLREADSLPGLVAAYALPSGRVGVAASGLANLDTGAPLAPHARMLAGSVGKTFVAATALALVEQGRLELDANVEDYLGNRTWLRRLPGAEVMTLRHLLNHTSGLVDHVYDEDFAAALASLMSTPDDILQPEELVEFILDDPPRFGPGEGWAYSDTGYILAGLVLEAASGSPYEQLLTDTFLDPLELVQTTPQERVVPYLATGHLAAENPLGLPTRTVREGVMIFDPGLEWTGGGLASNPADLVRWAKALYEERALSGPYLDELVGSAVPTGSGSRYGLGVLIQETDLGTTWGHGGWFPGYRTVMAYFSETQIAIAVQANTDVNVRMDHYRDELARLVLLQLEMLQSGVD
jgi:D-alanyl-D-alanine carboxypeptidase